MGRLNREPIFEFLSSASPGHPQSQNYPFFDFEGASEGHWTKIQKSASYLVCPRVLRACKKNFRCLAQKLKTVLIFARQLFWKIFEIYFGGFPYDVIIFFQLFWHSWIELTLLLLLILGLSKSIKNWLSSAKNSTEKAKSRKGVGTPPP